MKKGYSPKASYLLQLIDHKITPQSGAFASMLIQVLCGEPRELIHIRISKTAFAFSCNRFLNRNPVEGGYTPWPSYSKKIVSSPKSLFTTLLYFYAPPWLLFISRRNKCPKRLLD